MKKSSILAKLALVALSTFCSLLFIEAALRLIAPSTPFHSTFALYPHRKRLLRVTMQGKTKVITQSTNAWGLRGDEPPSDWEKFTTIVTIGGSTTQCYYLDDAATWPAQLQKKLSATEPNIWVGNAGLDGHTTYGHVQLMKQVIAYIHPKIIIVLCGINDTAQTLHPTSTAYDNPGRWTWRLYTHSRVARMLYTWFLIARHKAYHVQESPRGYDPQPLAAPDSAPTREELQPRLAAYQDRIHQMIEMARAMNARIIFLTQPVLWDNSPFWQTHEGDFFWMQGQPQHYSGATCWDILKQYNQALLDECRTEHIESLDAASSIPHSSLYFYDYMHFNDAGVAAKVADEVAHFLNRKNP